MSTYDVAYYAAHREERLAYLATYRATHKEQIRAKDAAYNASHKEQRRANYVARAEELKAHQATYRAAIKLEVFNAYGGPKCACCGETLLEGLSIDHIGGGGAIHRKSLNGGGAAIYFWLRKNGFPPGYQVLCYTCNFAKGTGDHCPHADRLARMQAALKPQGA